jgi:CRP-like cAMP-binding protein
MMDDATPEIRNQLLAMLSEADHALIAPNLSPLLLEKGCLLYEPGDPIETVYFPRGAVISLMTLMHSGEAIETSTIGGEGAFGLAAAVAPKTSLSRAIVQIAGPAVSIPRETLHAAWAQSPSLQVLVDRHTEALYAHAIQSVACNALHSVEARFCRWILCCLDRIAGNRVSLTQEFLADMLGVQRTTVTAVARALQASGLIHYRRGVVDVLDRRGLETISCECYRRVRNTYDRLLPSAGGLENPTA